MQKLTVGLFPDQIELVRKVNQIVMVWSLIRGSPESIRCRLIKLCMCGGGELYGSTSALTYAMKLSQ